MKTKKQKKKILALIIIGLILTTILFVSGFFYWQQQNKPFTLDSLDLSDWTKNKQPIWFWFPKNDITVVKHIKDSYSIEDNINFESPLKQENINVVINYQPIFKIREELKKQKFIELPESTGFYGNNENSASPYYVITYQKNNTICQLSFIFECFDQRCQLDPPGFGCANFNLESEYQKQQVYYKIEDYKPNYQNHEIAIITASKNPKGFLVINAGSWLDGGSTFFDQNNKQICEGKACCDQSSKSQFSNTWGDWCTDDYQTVDTYQPVGL